MHEASWNNEYQVQSEQKGVKENLRKNLNKVLSGDTLEEIKSAIKGVDPHIVRKRIDELMKLETIVGQGHIARDFEKNDMKAYKHYMSAAKKGGVQMVSSMLQDFFTKGEVSRLMSNKVT
eukprot:TRINITY_DN13778_c0_g1_i1.p1 TRINITY_DN13778_c0_g1~~TRINITY_DN13778_c0_g1_i1.p1  ORF type:complete len:120 (+),score=18.59 TRINITY_DN13778_c0_g1_i1:127-486(+)